jgi:hypothetical protein
VGAEAPRRQDPQGGHEPPRHELPRHRGLRRRRRQVSHRVRHPAYYTLLFLSSAVELPWEFVRIPDFISAAEIDLATITDRMEVKRAVQSGNVQEAIEKINDLNPTVRFCLCS